MTFQNVSVTASTIDSFPEHLTAPMQRWSWKFRTFKRSIDIVFSVFALPIIAVFAVVLFVLNPFFNPGPVFYRQERMGLEGKVFRVWKFRSMTEASGDADVRAHDEALEKDRITPLGGIIRKLRIDELPNFFNVLFGDMSLVGPRPDALSHAEAFMGTIPHYADRFRVRPGITGLAQVRAGYAESVRAVRKKALFDRKYVQKSCGRLELYILARTVRVVVTGFGAR